MVVLAINDIFDVKKKVVIGVVHLLPLPGSPLYRGNLEEVLDRAIKDAEALEEGGVDGIIVENLGDVPFRIRVRNPLTISAFSVIAREVSRQVSVPLGINFLRNSAIEAAAIAHISAAKFIRVNAYVETVATDSGILRPVAPELLRFMKNHGIRLGVLADIHVKHGKVLGMRSIEETARDAVERGLASAIVITGRRSGKPPSCEDLKEAKKTGAYVFVGSGLTPSNVDLLEYADGAIVGTFFKKDGNIYNPVDKKRVETLVNLIRQRW